MEPRRRQEGGDGGRITERDSNIHTFVIYASMSVGTTLLNNVHMNKQEPQYSVDVTLEGMVPIIIESEKHDAIVLKLDVTVSFITW